MIVADLVATLRLDDQMSSGLAQAGQAINDIASNTGKTARATMDSAQREVGQQIKSYGKAVSGVWDDAIDVAADYSQALADIDAVAGDLSDFQMDALNSQIKDLAAGTRYNARQTAGAAEELLKAGVSFGDLTGGALQGTLDLAAAGGIGVERAAEVLAQGLNTVGDSMQYVSDRDGNGLIDTLDKAAHFNDVLSQSANTSMTDISGLGDSWENVGSTISATGQDFETGIAALTAMSAFGTEGAEAGTALKSALNGLVKNATDLEDIGVGVFDDAGNFRDILDIFSDLDAVTADWSEGDRAKFLLDTFSAYGQKAAGQLLDFNDKAGQSLNELEQDLLNPGAAAEAAAKRMNSYPGALETIAGAQERLQLAFAEPAVEAQIPGMRKWADALNGVADVAYDLPAPVRAALGSMTGLSGTLLQLGGEAIYAAPGLRYTAEAFQDLKKAPGIAGKLARVAPYALKALGVAGLAAGAGLAAYQGNFLGFADTVDAATARLGLAGEAIGEGWAFATEHGLNPAAAGMSALAQGARVLGMEGIADQLSAGAQAAQNFGNTFEKAFATEQKQRLSGLAAGISAFGTALRAATGVDLMPLTTGLANALDVGTAGYNRAIEAGLNPLEAGLMGVRDIAADLTGLDLASAFDGLGSVIGPAAEGVRDFLGALTAGDFQGASDQLMGALQGASDGAMQLLNQGGDWLAGLDLGGMLTLDEATLGNISAAGTNLGSQIGEKLIAGLQGAGGIKDYLTQNLPSLLSGLGGAKDTVIEAISGTFDDLMTPADSLGGPGERGEAFGSAANILSGFTTFLSGVKDGMAAEFEAAFASGALPTPSADFIVQPITAMLEAAQAGVASAFSGFKAFLAEQLVGLLETLDALPGTEFAAEIYAYEQILRDLQGTPIESFPDARIDYAENRRVAQGLSDEARLIDAAVFQLEGSYEAVENTRAGISAMMAEPPPPPPSGPSQIEQFFDWLLPDPGYLPDPSDAVAGAAAAGARAQGADAARGEMGGEFAALIAAENARQAELQTLLAEKQQTQSLMAQLDAMEASGFQARQGLWQAASVSPTYMASPDYGKTEGTYGTGSMGPAGQEAAGGALPGGDMAAQVTQMFAAAQAAAQAGMTQLTTTITSGMATLTSTASASLTAFATQVQTSMTTAFTSASAAAQAGMQAIVAAVQSGIAQIQAAAGQAQAAGAAIGQGLVAGLNSQLGAVQAASAALGAAAEAGLQSTVQMGSPSQMAVPYGQSIAEGLAFGMQQKSPEVLQAAEALGYSAEEGLAPLMDGLSLTGAAAGKALGVDMEQALAGAVNGMEGWDPKSQIDYEALGAFDDAAVKMARYGKRAGDDAATKAGEAFKGLADNMSAVLMGSETYLSDELARQALKSYRRLDADAKAKLPDGIKDQLKATYDEANITIGDVIKQRMAGAGFEGGMKGGLGAMFKERKEMILRGMLGQRTLEQKAQAAAEDGLSLAIDAVKQGLMSAAPSAEGAAQSAMQQALGSIGGPAGGAGGGLMGGADPEEFAWALCECITGGMTQSLAEAGIGETSTLNTLGHDLEGSIGGLADSPFVNSMRDAANELGSMHDASWLGGQDAASCISLCDQAADQMGTAAGDAAGAAMGSSLPAMPSGADMGKAAGGALGDSMSAQCVSLCGGTMDDLASGVAGGVADAGIGELAAKDATLDMGTAGAREMGKQLRSGIPGATLPTAPGASPDDMASGVADGLTSQCVSLCDDSGMSDAAGSLDSAASGMSDLGGQISQLTQSLIGQKFSETMQGIQDGLSGGGSTGGIPAGVEVPALIHQLNPNINRALNFDIAQTNPHAAALLGGSAPVHLQGGGSNPFAGKTPATQDQRPIEVHTTVELDGRAVGSSVLKHIMPGLGVAAQNRQRPTGEITRR